MNHSVGDTIVATISRIRVDHPPQPRLQTNQCERRRLTTDRLISTGFHAASPAARPLPDRPAPASTAAAHHQDFPRTASAIAPAELSQEATFFPIVISAEASASVLRGSW